MAYPAFHSSRPQCIAQLPWKSLSSFILGVALWCGTGLQAKAAPPETAPAELTTLISQIEAAANQRDVQNVMQFYSDDLTHSDGLTHSDLEQALTQLWGEYPNLTYQTELKSWERDGSGFVAETATQLRGTRTVQDRQVTLEATIESRQRYEDGQIVQQDILSEQSQLMSGENPPTVNVNLPSQVGIGQKFTFDAIVQEPLGDRLLLGGAMEAPIAADGYFGAADLNLEVLSAGGLFKTGEAPATPESRWISAVLIREDGITSVSQRLQVTTDAGQAATGQR